MLTFGLAPYNLYMYTPTIRVSKGYFLRSIPYPIRKVRYENLNFQVGQIFKIELSIVGQ